MAPVVDRLGKEYAGRIEVKKMNVETDQTAASLAAQFRVQYVPTFVFVNADGTTSDVIVGEASEADLQKAFDALR